MERFWDERAREDAYFFVDTRQHYGRPDAERFWVEGQAALETLLGSVDAEVRGGDRVVEIGCGLGRLTAPLAARAREVVALDVSPEMLGRAWEIHQALDNVRWMHGDGRTLTGIDDSSADLCISHVTFQHLPKPELTLGYVREMGRVLRPGGCAVFGFSNDPTAHRGVKQGAARALAGRLRERLGQVPRGQRNPAWLGSAVELDELSTAAQEAGMGVDRVAGAGTLFCVAKTRKADSASS